MHSCTNDLFCAITDHEATTRLKNQRLGVNIYSNHLKESERQNGTWSEFVRNTYVGFVSQVNLDVDRIPVLNVHLENQELVHNIQRRINRHRLGCLAREIAFLLLTLRIWWQLNALATQNEHI